MNTLKNTAPDSDSSGWEHLPPALRMAAMAGRVNPKYTNDRKEADAALSAAIKELVDDRSVAPRYNWDRNKESSQRQVLIEEQEERRKSLREEAEAMRRRLAQLNGKSSAISATKSPTSSTSPPIMEERKSQHDKEMLQKKLKKVDKMIAKESPGSKDYKKLQKKREEYLSQLGEDSNSTAENVHVPSSAVTSTDARKEQLRLEARRKCEEAERAAAEKLRMDHDIVDAEVRRQEQQQKDAAEEAELQRKEAIREEARRLREEALEKKRRAEEAADEAEKRRKEAIREEACRLKEEASVRRQRQLEAEKEEERRKKEARLEEARELKEKALERKRQEEASAARSSYEVDDKKRKQAFLEEARALKQAAMEKKRQEQASASVKTYEPDEQKRKEAFLEEARQLKAAALAEKEAQAAEEVSRRAEEEAEAERQRAEAAEEARQRRAAEHEHMLQMEAKRREEDAARRAEEQKRTDERKQEASQEYLDRRSLTEPFSENTKKILSELESMEERHKKLEKYLIQNGIPVSEDIPYEVAKDKICEITESMRDLASASLDPYAMEKKYNFLEEQLAKYSNALMLTDDYAEEQKRIEQEWEDEIDADNFAALQKIRSHMPVNVKSMTEEELASTPTPNGKSLPKAFGRKFKRTNILQLLRVNPDEIEKMHPSLLEGIRTTGLTLTERRAIHEHLKDIADRWEHKMADPSCEKKYQWFQVLKLKFKETLNSYSAHVDKYGPPGNHPYAKRNDPNGGGCPMLGNQCPLKADAIIDYNEDYGYPKEAIYESGSQDSSSRPTRKRHNSVQPSKSKASETEIIAELKSRLNLDSDESDVDKKLLRELFHAEKRTRSLEKQLTQAGLALPQEDISFSVAKAKVAELTEEIKEIAAKMSNCADSKEITRLESEFGKLSQELDKYNNALMLTKEWAKEQEDKEKQWEANVSPQNYEALQKIWRHMPVNIRDLSEDVLSSSPTPNGKTLPKAMAKKFKRTNILMLLRLDPADIEPMHPSSLESLRTTGLTLTERRALHEHLRTVAPKWQASSNDKMSERRWMWHASLKGKFKETLEKYEEHVQLYGSPDNHPYASRSDPNNGGCPLLGNQCPLKADLATDYSGDYGFPDYSVYMKEKVAKSNLMTMEELERRKLEDELEYGGVNYSGCSSPAPAVTSEGEAEVPQFGHLDVGIMTAIEKKPESQSTSAPTASGLPRPPMGGLLAEIGKKKLQVEADETPISKPPAPIGGLLAEIQRKGATKQESAPPETPTTKKRGLLAAITGRGRK